MTDSVLIPMIDKKQSGIIESLNQHIDRFLYTYITSYLAQAYRSVSDNDDV